MCEAGGRLTITYDDGSYLKGRIGHQGYYVPRKGGERMRKQALEHESEVVNAELVRGMLVRLNNGQEIHNTFVNSLITPRNNPGNGTCTVDRPNQVGFKIWEVINGYVKIVVVFIIPPVSLDSVLNVNKGVSL